MHLANPGRVKVRFSLWLASRRFDRHNGILGYYNGLSSNPLWTVPTQLINQRGEWHRFSTHISPSFSFPHLIIDTIAKQVFFLSLSGTQSLLFKSVNNVSVSSIHGIHFVL